MKMTAKRLLTGLVVAIVASAAIGWGRASENGSSRKVEVTFTSRSEFQNGGALPAGTYVMEVTKDSTTPEVRFYKLYTNGYAGEKTVGNKALATVPGKIVAEQQQASETQIVAETRGGVQVVKSIQPAGWHERIVFGSEMANGVQ